MCRVAFDFFFSNFTIIYIAANLIYLILFHRSHVRYFISCSNNMQLQRITCMLDRRPYILNQYTSSLLLWSHISTRLYRVYKVQQQKYGKMGLEVAQKTMKNRLTTSPQDCIWYKPGVLDPQRPTNECMVLLTILKWFVKISDFYLLLGIWVLYRVCLT